MEEPRGSMLPVHSYSFHVVRGSDAVVDRVGLNQSVDLLHITPLARQGTRTAVGLGGPRRPPGARDRYVGGTTRYTQ